MNKMKEYKFFVYLCNGTCCDGYLTVKAKNEDDAYEKVMYMVGKRLMKAFPELDIEYSVELCDESESE